MHGWFNAGWTSLIFPLGYYILFFKSACLKPFDHIQIHTNRRTRTHSICAWVCMCVRVRLFVCICVYYISCKIKYIYIFVHVNIFSLSDLYFALTWPSDRRKLTFNSGWPCHVHKEVISYRNETPCPPLLNSNPSLCYPNQTTILRWPIPCSVPRKRAELTAFTSHILRQHWSYSVLSCNWSFKCTVILETRNAWYITPGSYNKIVKKNIFWLF